MAKHETMSAAMLERVAEQFRALGEPSRLLLMNLLFDAEHTVGELVTESGLSLANVSKHLGILHQAGWVTRRKVCKVTVTMITAPPISVICPGFSPITAHTSKGPRITSRSVIIVTSGAGR